MIFCKKTHKTLIYISEKGNILSYSGRENLILPCFAFTEFKKQFLLLNEVVMSQVPVSFFWPCPSIWAFALRLYWIFSNKRYIHNADKNPNRMVYHFPIFGDLNIVVRFFVSRVMHLKIENYQDENLDPFYHFEPLFFAFIDFFQINGIFTMLIRIRFEWYIICLSLAILT